MRTPRWAGGARKDNVQGKTSQVREQRETQNLTTHDDSGGEKAKAQKRTSRQIQEANWFQR